MQFRIKAAVGALLAFAAGIAIAASSAPADPVVGWNAHLSEADLAMSVAACDCFGEAAGDVSWCVDAYTAAEEGEDIADLAETASVDDEGGQISVSLSGIDSVLVTTIPGEE